MKIGIGLIFPGELKDESVICYLCKNFEINLNIIEASFSMASGWAFLELEGHEQEVERALQYVESKNIKIERLKTEKE